MRLILASTFASLATTLSILLHLLRYIRQKISFKVFLSPSIPRLQKIKRYCAVKIDNINMNKDIIAADIDLLLKEKIDGVNIKYREYDVYVTLVVPSLLEFVISIPANYPYTPPIIKDKASGSIFDLNIIRLENWNSSYNLLAIVYSIKIFYNYNAPVFRNNPKNDNKSSSMTCSSFGIAEMQGKRVTMEDKITTKLNLINGLSFFGLFDGHGGNKTSEYVSINLHERLSSFLKMGENIQSAIKKSILQVEEELVKEHVPSDNSGTTCIVTIIQNGILFCANLGDSRAVLCREDDVSLDLSKDHKPSGASEIARIVLSDGFVNCGRVNGILSVSRAIGDLNVKQMKPLTKFGACISTDPDIKTISLNASDRYILMACDGLWDVFSSKDAISFVSLALKSHGDLNLIAKQLGEEAIKKGSTDNVSIIIIKLKMEKKDIHMGEFDDILKDDFDNVKPPSISVKSKNTFGKKSDEIDDDMMAFLMDDKNF